MPPKGYKLSEDSKLKISTSKKKISTVRICLYCGKPYNAGHKEIKISGGKYCSQECYNNTRNKPISKICIHCGLKFEVTYNDSIRSTSKFCSKQCYLTHRKENPLPLESRKKMSIAHKGKPQNIEWKQKKADAVRGEKCHFWRGGTSFGKYCPKFNREFKERVRSFFNYTCVECGTPQTGRALGVHHINYNKKACCDSSIPMFVPLCGHCHNLTTNGDRTLWENYFADIIQNYYQGKSFFTKEEYAAYKNS